MFPALWPYGSHLPGRCSSARLCKVSAETASEDKEVSVYSRSYVILENMGHMALLFCLLFPAAVPFLSSGKKEG